MGGVALSLQVGSGITGPCNIHDNYMPFDLNSTWSVNSNSVSYLNGCSVMDFHNNTMALRDPSNPSANYPMWQGTDNSLLIWMALQQGTTNSAQANRPAIAEYNDFMSCNARCFAATNFDIRHNYYQGININAPGASAAHGDGIIATGYNGPTALEFAQQCSCSGYNQTLETGDTWLLPAYGAGTTTCITCVAIQVPAFTLNGWTSGDDILHVTAVSHLYPTMWPDIGAPIGSGLTSPTEPWAAIAECETAAGIIGCNLGQAASCSPTAPCLYTMTSPMQPCVSTTTQCAYNFNFPADWIDVEYTHNVWVANMLNATGSGEEGPGGPAGGGVSAFTFMSYMRVSYGTFSNNYMDPCGASTNNPNTGWPNYACPAQTFANPNPFVATGDANIATVGVNNVNLLTGQCTPIFGETTYPTDCLP